MSDLCQSEMMSIQGGDSDDSAGRLLTATDGGVWRSDESLSTFSWGRLRATDRPAEFHPTCQRTFAAARCTCSPPPTPINTSGRHDTPWWP